MLGNDTYTYRFIPQSEISEIECVWKELERGNEMTYFQTFDWHRMLISLTPQSERIESGYFLIYKGSKSILIAPLWIIKKWNPYNGKGVYFIGRKGFSDYLNFIYTDFDENAVDFLMKSIRSCYKISTWHFESIKESSSLYKFIRKKIEKKIFKLEKELSIKGGCLELPSDVDTYSKSLSKNTRQNLRTALNRANKDGITFTFCNDDILVDKNYCERIRKERSKKKASFGKEKLSLPKKLLFIIRHTLFKKYNIHFPAYLPFRSDKNSRLLTITNEANGELAAFFNYGFDDNHNEVVVMAAGVNEKYAKYSPGMIAMKHFIDEAIVSKTIRRVDFTRGDEPYKFHLGSKEHFVKTLSIKIMK